MSPHAAAVIRAPSHEKPSSQLERVSSDVGARPSRHGESSSPSKPSSVVVSAVTSHLLALAGCDGDGGRRVSVRRQTRS